VNFIYRYQVLVVHGFELAKRQWPIADRASKRLPDVEHLKLVLLNVVGFVSKQLTNELRDLTKRVVCVCNGDGLTVAFAACFCYWKPRYSFANLKTLVFHSFQP